MKTALISSAFALMIAPAALADQMAVVDFNQDGIVSEVDFIGSKARINQAIVSAATPQVMTQEVTRVVTAPATANTVPASDLAPEFGNYVSIGEYKGGTMGTLAVAPATTRTVTETRQVIGTPAAATTVADIYPEQLGSIEANVSTELKDAMIYQPSIGADGVFTAAEMGYVDDQYADDRLAAYDTNKDGQVTTSEAIANLDPRIDPNVAAFHGGVNSAGYLQEINGGGPGDS